MVYFRGKNQRERTLILNQLYYKKLILTKPTNTSGHEHNENLWPLGRNSFKWPWSHSVIDFRENLLPCVDYEVVIEAEFRDVSWRMQNTHQGAVWGPSTSKDLTKAHWSTFGCLLLKGINGQGIQSFPCESKSAPLSPPCSQSQSKQHCEPKRKANNGRKIRKHCAESRMKQMRDLAQRLGPPRVLSIPWSGFSCGEDILPQPRN